MCTVLKIHARNNMICFNQLTYVVQTSQDLLMWNDFAVNPGTPGQQVSVTVPVQAGLHAKFACLLAKE